MALDALHGNPVDPQSPSSQGEPAPTHIEGREDWGFARNGVSGGPNVNPSAGGLGGDHEVSDIGTNAVQCVRSQSILYDCSSNEASGSYSQGESRTSGQPSTAIEQDAQDGPPQSIPQVIPQVPTPQPSPSMSLQKPHNMSKKSSAAIGPSASAKGNACPSQSWARRDLHSIPRPGTPSSTPNPEIPWKSVMSPQHPTINDQIPGLSGPQNVGASRTRIPAFAITQKRKRIV